MIQIESKDVVVLSSLIYLLYLLVPIWGVLNPALVLSDDASNAENPLAEPINNDGQDDLIEPDQVNGNDAPPPEIIAEPPRYKRRDNRRKPPHFDDYVCSNVDMCYSVSSVSIPRTYSEAIDSPECSQWKEAMNNEINSLKLNDTYDLVLLPQGKKAVGGRWVFSIKDYPDGSEMFKACFVAKGYTQVKGIDYYDTFSLTAKMTSIRSFIQIDVEHGLCVHQMDVKAAFLNAPIDCDLFIQQPKGYEKYGNNDTPFVCKLKRSLYGLKQSGRNWNNTLHQFLIENLFERSGVDPCFYFCKSDTVSVIVLIWVDDLVLGAREKRNYKK